MKKENEENNKLMPRPYTWKNVVAAQNRKIKKINKTFGRTVTELWKPKSNQDL